MSTVLEHDSYLTAGRTVRSWLVTTDHKRIGLLFLGMTTLMLAIGGTAALIMRLELLTPAADLVGELTYNRLFTIHGIIMVWLFLIPAIPSVFGNFFVPIMVGARDVAFPRLNLASVYVYAIGAVTLLTGLFVSAPDTGWTFYPPYSGQTLTGVTIATIAIFILAISSTMTGLNMIVTVHALRAKGLIWSHLPLFVWAIYATAIVLVFATPVLAMSLALVALDHGLGWGLFDPAAGGDPILFQHLFWFYSHPAVYVMILPSMGVMSEVVETFAHRFTFSYWSMVVATIGLALVGFLVWGHHLFVAGISRFDAGSFAFLSMAVAIFSAIKAFVWMATLRGGSIDFKTPLAYFVAFVFLFGWGGLSGVAVATLSLDLHWHDTYFVVGHFHFVMVGAAMMGFLSALHYWWPKMFNRLYPERWALLACAVVSVGFVVTFTPQFLLGNAGMPRRYASYAPEFQVLNVISTVGSWALATGMSIIPIYLGWSLLHGEKAGPNPWQSRGFEWMTESPPPTHNFAEPPVITRRPHNYYEP
jgi:cytochrome c oxidase subunit 1